MAAVRRATMLAVMPITSHSTAARRSRFLGRVDGIELPVPAAWIVPGNRASLSFSVPGRLRSDSRIGRALDATLVFADDPDHVLVDVLFDAPSLEILGSPPGTIGPPIHLEGWAVPGGHRWALSGDVFTADGRALPVGATLAYHGVWCRGDRAHGWFVLAGAIDPPADTTRRRLRFSFELLADGPQPGSRSVPAPSWSYSIRGPSQTRGAA
jgi:hypothetical protein